MFFSQKRNSWFKIASSLLLVSTIVIGCAKIPSQTATIDTDFGTLLKINPNPKQIIEFLDENISLSTKESGSKMIMALEEAQKNNLSNFEHKFNESGIQQEIDKVYKPDFSLIDIDKISNEILKNLLVSTKENGLKVETTEGMYYPVIDYELYKKYENKVTADVKEYINIFSKESNNPPAKDAAIIITWDDVLKRARNQAQFISEYPNSARLNEAKKLYNKYVSFILYGANNTPLFNYDNQTMNPYAKTAYLKAADAINKSDNAFNILLKDYVTILKENNYKLTENVELYRKENAPVR